MSDYLNGFGAATKDATQAVIAASDIGDEFDKIVTAIATKTDKIIPAGVGNIATLTSGGNLSDGGVSMTAYTKTILDDADAGAVKDTLLLSTSTTITPSSNADVTITPTQATYGRLILVDGSWIAGHNIIVPDNQRKYLVDNSSGTYDAVVKTSLGTGITVKAGTSRLLVCDGTNVVDPLTAFIQDTDKATSAEVITGTNDTKFITPASLRGGALVSGTAIATTSGTSHDFTGIPSWVKRITVMIAGLSTNGTDIPIIQLGDSGGIETSGYLSAYSVFAAAAAASVNSTTGFVIPSGAPYAGATLHGTITLNLLDTNTWTCAGIIAQSDTTRSGVTSGSKALTGTLDRIRLTTILGTDTFDAGSINIIYE